jgi:phosphoribosylamine--glycine ligase
MIKILVVGGGGREHALIWKIKQSHPEAEIYCAPGNGGIARTAECVSIPATDVGGMVVWARRHFMDLVIVAQDDPLSLGMVDALQENRIRAFGPTRACAQIEWSKSYSKELMKKYNIPTAAYEAFDSAGEAYAYLESAAYPIVVKADGLALGKGVLICETKEQAADAVRMIMEDKKFGEAGSRVVIEEFMTGPEVSILAFCDGKTILPMLSAQDHKRAFDGDHGPNTGGMGTFSPSPKYTREVQEEVERTIIHPTVDALRAEGRNFVGVIFFGLMLTQNGPKVLEYNARLGDPEAQSVFMLLKNDLLDVMEACIDGKLNEIKLEFEPGSAVCVVMASGGYPGKYPKGLPIEGLDDVDPDVVVFHAGTKVEVGRIVTNGGRVLGVTARGEDIPAARKKAYANVEKIRFDGAQFRRDIGIK